LGKEEAGTVCIGEGGEKVLKMLRILSEQEEGFKKCFPETTKGK